MTADASPRASDAAEADCRRRQPRRRVLLAGKIVQTSGLSMDCTIRNLTDEGAQVRVPPGQALPDAFDLIEIRSGVAYRAKVAWRSASGAGVKFTGRVDLNRSGAGAPLHLRTLWLGCASRGPGVSEGG